MIFQNVYIITGQVIKFADGTNLFLIEIYFPYTKLYKKANEEFCEVDCWPTTNRLTLKTKKKPMFITVKTPNRPALPLNLESKLNGNAMQSKQDNAMQTR